MSRPTLDGLKATYSAKGTGGVHVAVSGHSVEIVGTSGRVFIEVVKWGATKQLVDEAIAHYQAIDTNQDEAKDG